MESCGILIGADKGQQWLIPWFYKNYSSCNNLPVAICDFGMTEEGKRLCTEDFSMRLLSPCLKEVAFSYNPTKLHMSNYCSSYYSLCRGAWFKKAQALICSPFTTTLWLDLDCEVLKNLDPLFDYQQQTPFIAMVRDINDGNLPYPLYNGGVILYDKRVPVITKLARDVLNEEEQFWGDDHLLSLLLAQIKQEVIELPYHCNWRFEQGALADVFIFHWVARWGKDWIRQHGGIKAFHDILYQ